MTTETREIKVKILDNKEEAIEWLKSEYPHGLDLIYVDYNDQYHDMTSLQRLLKEGWEANDEDWQGDADWETRNQVKENYKKEMETDEISEEVSEGMDEWLWDHDTSNPTKDLLRNTGRKLCYINTTSNSISAGNTGCGNIPELVRKFGKTTEEKAEIKAVLNEQFYEAPVSFYFYADVEDLFETLHGKDSDKWKYIHIDGAYFGTVDRIQGSNWLGEKNLFKIVMKQDDFIRNFFLDEAKGTGYRWNEICGGSRYEDAGIFGSETRKKDYQLIETEVSAEQEREENFQKKWDKEKTCSFGDMNMKRHEKTEYINEIPCGIHCRVCGNFWID